VSFAGGRHRDGIHRASLPAHTCNAAGKICTLVNLGAPTAQSVRPSWVSCWYTTSMIFWSGKLEVAFDGHVNKLNICIKTLLEK